MRSAVAPQVLRVAAAWGTTIVGVKLLDPGQDCILGDTSEALAVIPGDVEVPTAPLRSVGSGWELDARGAMSGLLLLRGRQEDVVRLARSGAPVPVVPGDYGLVQYGLFSVFFQYTAAAAALGEPRARWAAPFAWLRETLIDEPLAGLALVSSLILHLGLLGLLIVNWTPPPYQLPPELVSPEDYAARFGLKRVLPDVDLAGAKADAGGSSRKDQGPKEPKKQPGGAKIAGKEGKAGLGGKDDHAELPGDVKPVTNYGGLSEALADTGTEIKKTLSEIQTVADALGGLSSANVVLASGPGAGLRGAGSGGGGVGPGVLFGSGTLNTGWGPGNGGGFGNGAGRGGGFGGSGGGTGTGSGSGGGPGERGMLGTSAGASHGGLNQEQIRRVVIAHKGALQACYEIEAEKDPSLRGGVTVSWTIDPSGAVTSAGLAGSTIHNARVEGCVLRQVHAWHFPSSDGSSQAVFPFAFGIGR
jgi:hypothetical protein